MPSRRVLGCLAAVALLTAACSSAQSPTLESLPEPSDPVVIEAVELEDAAADAVVVATATVPRLEVFATPADDEPLRVLDHPNDSGGPTVVLVQEAEPDWLLVQLPVRPNGSTGWVRLADVELSTHQYRIEVHLRDFDIRVFHEDRLVFQTVVAVARDNAPTPGGSYYITELLRPTQPDTIYGRFAYGLSGFSDTFETFRGGPGQLGIHGTNDPDTLGTPVSNGCIRLHDNDIALLVEVLPLGVPVDVFA
ncbi:MAG: L,D-transpeptidase [Acidimicrobiales bacterium]